MKFKPLLLVFGLMVFLGGFLVFGDTGSEDPLITLSYLEMRLREWAPSSSEGSGEQAVFEVIEVQEGDRLTLGQGTEVILRAGEARAFVTPRGGIADVTAGKDIGMDEMIPRNHHLINPVADGRGFIFMSQSWIMIKGIHTINEDIL
jgi:hypothetical protein